MSAKPTYWDYLKLDSLLSLQAGLEEDESQLTPDELHFIIVHQAYELWFKLILRELRLGRDALAQERMDEEQVPVVVHHLGRVNEIMRLLVEQFRVMETLTPQDFLAFRDKLVPASGFQSFQMREVEVLLGLEDAARTRLAGADPLEHIRQLAQGSPGGRHAWSAIEAARQETSVRAALRNWLYRTPIQGSFPDEEGDDAVVEQFLEEYLAAQGREQELQKSHFIEIVGASPEKVEEQFAGMAAGARAFLTATDVEDAAERKRVRRVRAGLLFIESYRDLPLLAWPRLLIDTVVELEEQLVLFRNRHARMVERVIGRRIGTGGSSGVDYLDATTRHRIFDDLWMVRTQLIRADVRPELRGGNLYAFRQA